MKACPERSAALALLRKYNAEPFHIQHGLTVEGVMRWYAQELGYGEDADFWAAVGLLHDVDFEKWPEAHCKKAPELLAEIGCSDEFIHAVCSHGYGLCSDVEPTEEMEKVYSTVLEAQKAGIAMAKAGVPGCDIHNAAHDVIRAAGYGEYFGHGFGHSLGLEIHEDPGASPANKEPMPLHCAVSAEPGIYLPGRFGVRIEDVIVLTEDGNINLTGSPKELIVL